MADPMVECDASGFPANMRKTVSVRTVADTHNNFRVPQACVVLELCTPTPQSGHRVDDAPARHR